MNGLCPPSAEAKVDHERVEPFLHRVAAPLLDDPAVAVHRGGVHEDDAQLMVDGEAAGVVLVTEDVQAGPVCGLHRTETVAEGRAANRDGSWPQHASVLHAPVEDAERRAVGDQHVEARGDPGVELREAGVVPEKAHAAARVVWRHALPLWGQTSIGRAEEPQAGDGRRGVIEQPQGRWRSISARAIVEQASRAGHRRFRRGLAGLQVGSRAWPGLGVERLVVVAGNRDHAMGVARRERAEPRRGALELAREPVRGVIPRVNEQVARRKERHRQVHVVRVGHQHEAHPPRLARGVGRHDGHVVDRSCRSCFRLGHVRRVAARGVCSPPGRRATSLARSA